MGTLTAALPRLSHYCAHKLPTSCRLSSIGECCACYDERPHAATYTVYVDGLGLVPRGTRWQRYCWFCKEFWTNRVNASGLRPGQTRIPEVPDQGEFLERWYEFHRGYRVVGGEGEREERVAVLGEDMRDVEPGCLPRTLEESREGRERSAVEEEERERQQRLRAAAVQQEQEAATGPSLEDTLDQLALDAETDDAAVTAAQPAPARTNVHAQAMAPAGSRNREYQARRIAALRRELHRMRNGIERVITGLREFGETVPDAGEATGRLTTLGRTLDDISGEPSSATDQATLAIRSVNEQAQTAAPASQAQPDRTLVSMQSRIDEARSHLDEARRMRAQAARDYDAAEEEVGIAQQRFQALRRDQNTAENYQRLFGTRDEMLAQGEDYESPIGGLFSRAYERFNVAEEVRREERTLRQVMEDEARSGGEDGQRWLEAHGHRQRDVWGVPLPTPMPMPVPPRLAQDETGNTSHLMEEARDEVFAGQTLAAMAEEAQEVAENAELAGSAPPGHNDSGDTALEEYYALLRSQGWSQQAGDDAAAAPGRNFPRSMLDGVRSAPQREDQVRNATLREGDRETSNSRSSSLMEPYSATSIDRREDFVHVLHFLRTHDDWRIDMELEVNQVYMGLVVCVSSHSNSDVLRELVPRMSAVMGGMDPTTLLQRDDLVWKSGLPAARLVRIRRAGHRVSFSNQPQSTDSEVMRGNVEVMAEVFQMSAELRRKSGLAAQEQLDMLGRLQSGQRLEADRTVLASMLLEDETVELAASIHREQPSPQENSRQTALDEQRRQAARDGDYSRQGLDSQRRATSAFAEAAARLATHTGPRALTAQDSLARARALYTQDHMRFDFTSRLAQLGPRPFNRRPSPSSHSEASDEEEEDPLQGLDARDSGRPAEPLSEEAMTVKLECRICYAQVADVACLPCGHLVMCKWCSEQHSPTMAHDRTRPRRAAACPVCRKGVRQKVRVFRGT